MGKVYDQLRAVAQLDYDDHLETMDHQSALIELAQCQEMARTFRQQTGMAGATQDAALDWLDKYEKSLAAQATVLQNLSDNHTTARGAMWTATQACGELSPQLLSAGEIQFFQSLPTVELKGVGTVTGAEYLNYLAAERDAERDAAAQKILDTMDAEIKAIGDPRDRVLTPGVGATSDGAGGATMGSVTVAPLGGGDTGGVRAPGIRPPGAVVPPPITPPIATPPPPPIAPPLPGQPGDPLPPGHGNTPVYPPSGEHSPYVPPSVVNGNDPRWASNYRIPGTANTQAAAMMVGGVVGLGATALAARTMGGDMSAMSALSMRAAAGGGNAASLNAAAARGGRVPGNGALGAQQTGATGKQAGGSRLARAGGKQGGGRGLGGTEGGKQARTGSRGRGSAASEGANKRRKDKRDPHSLVGYDVLRLQDEQDLRVTPVEGAGAGSSEHLAPLARHDDDQW